MRCFLLENIIYICLSNWYLSHDSLKVPREISKYTPWNQWFGRGPICMLIPGMIYCSLVTPNNWAQWTRVALVLMPRYRNSSFECDHECRQYDIHLSRRWFGKYIGKSSGDRNRHHTKLWVVSMMAGINITRCFVYVFLSWVGLVINNTICQGSFFLISNNK